MYWRRAACVEQIRSYIFTPQIFYNQRQWCGVKASERILFFLFFFFARRSYLHSCLPRGVERKSENFQKGLKNRACKNWHEHVGLLLRCCYSAQRARLGSGLHPTPRRTPRTKDRGEKGGGEGHWERAEKRQPKKRLLLKISWHVSRLGVEASRFVRRATGGAFCLRWATFWAVDGIKTWARR